MCLGGKKDSGSSANIPAPKPRVDPVEPEYDMLRDPVAAMAGITGVHTSARGATDPLNVGKVQVNGPGTALPASAFITPVVVPPPAPPTTPPLGGGSSTPKPKKPPNWKTGGEDMLLGAPRPWMEARYG